jgi:hypothetical protein
MSATPPAPAPAARPRPPAAWLAFSAKMTAQVPAIAERADLTVTVAPGAGRGAPACFFPATAEIEVNGDHLPVDPATANPASPADRERYPALWGATVHECAHAAHSRWRAPEGTSAAWSAAATALEESRIEARQITRRPGDRTWLRASTCQIVIRDFAAAATPPASPAEAGSAAALILARGDAGILEPAETGPVEQAVAAAIGAGKLGQLRAVWREAHATRDDDAKAMVRLGRRWCRILGITPDQPAPKADPSQPGQGTPSPITQAVGEAAAAVAAASAAELAPPPPFPPGQAEAREAENSARRQAGSTASRVFARDPADGSGGACGSRASRPARSRPPPGGWHARCARPAPGAAPTPPSPRPPRPAGSACGTPWPPTRSAPPGHSRPPARSPASSAAASPPRRWRSGSPATCPAP